MSDLISRQAAIDAILSVTIFDSERSLREYTQKTGSDKWCEGVIEAMDAVTEVPSVQPDLAQLLAYECGKASAQPEQRWIPCSERYPDMDERVLVYTVAHEYYVWDCMSNRADNYFWEDEEGLYHDKYEADLWMPLPEPYKEEQK